MKSIDDRCQDCKEAIELFSQQLVAPGCVFYDYKGCKVQLIGCDKHIWEIVQTLEGLKGK